MKWITCPAAAVAVWLVFAASVCFGAGGAGPPSVFFPQTIYEFSPVLEDAAVVHDFVIQNKGKSVLHVDRVKTG